MSYIVEAISRIARSTCSSAFSQTLDYLKSSVAGFNDVA
jgi:hypothetical protein